MPFDNKVQCIDYCIHRIVAALNTNGIRTVASCCGHQTSKGNIVLEDGRVLVIYPNSPTTMEGWNNLMEFNEYDIPPNNRSSHRPDDNTGSPLQ